MSIFVHSIDLHSEPIKREGLASFPRVLSLWSMCNTRIITRYWTNNLTSYCPVTIWVTIRAWKLSLRGWPRQSAAYHPQPINENDYQQIETQVTWGQEKLYICIEHWNVTPESWMSSRHHDICGQSFQIIICLTLTLGTVTILNQWSLCLVVSMKL